MKNLKIFSFFCFFNLLFQTQNLRADWLPSNPAFSPDFYLGKTVEWVLAMGTYLGDERTDAYIQIVDAPTQARLSRAQNLIQTHPAWNYRYKNLKLVIIRGQAEEPNAFSIGPVIYVSWSILKLLNDRELIAVLAHEMAHSERAHLLQRLPVPLGASLLSLASRLSLRQTSPGEAKGLINSIQELISTAHIAMELQADCLAAKQLSFMGSQGLANHPLDLLRATSKMLGYDVAHDSTPGPDRDRAQAILAQTYLGSCEFSL